MQKHSHGPLCNTILSHFDTQNILGSIKSWSPLEGSMFMVHQVCFFPSVKETSKISETEVWSPQLDQKSAPKSLSASLSTEAELMALHTPWMSWHPVVCTISPQILTAACRQRTLLSLPPSWHPVVSFGPEAGAWNQMYSMSTYSD